MIQVDAKKVQKMIGEGLTSLEISASFFGKYSTEEINVFKPAPIKKKRAPRKKKAE